MDSNALEAMRQDTKPDPFAQTEESFTTCQGLSRVLGQLWCSSISILRPDNIPRIHYNINFLSSFYISHCSRLWYPLKPRYYKWDPCCAAPYAAGHMIAGHGRSTSSIRGMHWKVRFANRQQAAGSKAIYITS